jgi:hypothetical protein
LPCAGAPGALGAIRTIGNGKFVDGVAEPVHGDTWFAVIEFEQSGAKAEALLGYLLRGTLLSSKSFQFGQLAPIFGSIYDMCIGAARSRYGNWSKAGSKHVEDQMALMSQNELRPVWRARAEVEANLESRTVLTL